MLAHRVGSAWYRCRGMARVGLEACRTHLLGVPIIVTLDSAVRILAEVLAVSLAAVLLQWRCGNRSLLALVASVVAALYGARAVARVVFGNESIASSLAAALSGWPGRGPTSVLGAIAGGLCGLALSAWLLGVPVLKALDCVAVPVAAGQSLGRISCLLAGCCFGTPTTLPWGIRYPPTSPAGFASASAPLHPVQLYEGVGCLLLAVALSWCLRARCPAGTVVSAYLLGYGALRFALQYFRGDPVRRLWCFSVAHWICLGFLAAGVVGAILAWRGRGAARRRR